MTQTKIMTQTETLNVNEFLEFNSLTTASIHSVRGCPEICPAHQAVNAQWGHHRVIVGPVLLN